MSYWVEIKDENIDVDHKAKEVNIFYEQDKFGAKYVYLTFDQIRNIYNQITGVET